MSEILTDLSPSSLAVAIKANLYAFFQQFRHASVATVHDSPSMVRWHTPIAHPWFNGVLSIQPPADDGSEAVRGTLAYFRSRAVASFTWWLAPHLEPVAWSAHLLPYGFRHDDHTPGMAIDLAQLPSSIHPRLTLRTVGDPGTLAQWVDIFVRGYGIPNAMAPALLTLVEDMGMDLPFRHYLGYLDDQPVATSTLFLGAGVAGIYNVATLAEVRGQGIGSTITRIPLHEARTMGYRAAILQSSDIGYRVYERLGFRKLCQMDHFYWTADNAPNDV